MRLAFACAVGAGIVASGLLAGRRVPIYQRFASSLYRRAMIYTYSRLSL